MQAPVVQVSDLEFVEAEYYERGRPVDTVVALFSRHTGAPWEPAQDQRGDLITPPGDRWTPVAFTKSQLRSEARLRSTTPERQWRLAVQEVGAAELLSDKVLFDIVRGSRLGDRTYIIDELLEEKTIRGVKKFKVRWRWIAQDDTWVSEAELPPMLVAAFRANGHATTEDASSDNTDSDPEDGGADDGDNGRSAAQIGWSRQVYTSPPGHSTTPYTSLAMTCSGVNTWN